MCTFKEALKKMADRKTTLETKMAQTKRIFIGKLFDGITELDLIKRFSHFGTIGGVEIQVKKDETGKPIKTFAFLDMKTDDKSLQTCISLLNNTKWKSKEICVEIAKECFYHKLLKQIAECKQQNCEIKTKEIVKSENLKRLDMKSAVPGTKIPGIKKWVISKYGRALPIVYIRRKDKKKIIMVDPSKYCHNIKQFKEETSPKVAKIDKMASKRSG